ncbi:hypothetical protein BKA58DRAFT_81086 [Alternaria rosae]|uniref:uncharacterized protein n=1 Tax=Alternaria rosae TaxID=1187941 RepID=UPI001E8D2C76|nr:uncharacterized protein BKA58DRAFT_81086 [Alternaria rosae]KAH6877709.1 hypothetical protein BKA58DRAFT_81086 [Alternaria rosae]
MALAQEVYQDCKYLLPQSLPQLQPRVVYVPELTSADQFSDFPDCTGMPESMMVSDACVVAASKLTTVKASHYVQTQPYALQRVEQEDTKPTGAAAATPSSNILAYSSGQHWSGVPTPPFDWHHAIQQTQPYIVPISDPQFRQNQVLTYNSTPITQNTIGKGFSDPIPWPSSELHGLPRGMTANSSVLDKSISPSPRSYRSDEFENTYSPGSMLDQASPCGNWNAPSATTINAAILSPPCRSFLAHDADGDTGYSGLPRMDADTATVTVPSSYPSRRDQAPIASFGDEHQSRSEYSHSQTSSAGHSPWYGENFAYNTSNLAFGTRDVVRSSHPASSTSISSTDEAHTSQYSVTPWNTSCPDGSVQSRIQDRFQVPRSAGAQAQREHNDQLLIDGKKRGETYKEIKLKMIGEKSAESTLRGRYRSLTKARKDRVRKPVWTMIDVSRPFGLYSLY